MKRIGLIVLLIFSISLVPAFGQLISTDHSLLSNLNWSVAGHTIDTDFLPNATLSHDIGSGALRWDWIYARNLSIENIEVSENIIVLGEINSPYGNFTELFTRGFNVSDISNLYLNLSGTNANQDINISPYDLEVYDIIVKNNDGCILFGGLGTSICESATGDMDVKSTGRIDVFTDHEISLRVDNDVNDYFHIETNDNVPTLRSFSSNMRLLADEGLITVSGAFYLEGNDIYGVNQMNATFFNWTTGDTWNSFDGSILLFNSSRLATIFYNASTIEVITGTPEGAIEDLRSFNSIGYNVSEDASDFELRINFTNITDFNNLIIRYKAELDFEAHDTHIDVWDYEVGEWEHHGDLPSEAEWNTPEFGIFDSSVHIGTGSDEGIVQVRVIQDGGLPPRTHKHEFDWITISLGLGTPAQEEVDPFFNNWLMNPVFNSGVNVNGSTVNSTWDWISANSLNITGTSYLGDLIIEADNITVNNIISKDGNISFWNSGGSEIVRFTDDGRVGIGTDSPNAPLEVVGVKPGVVGGFQSGMLHVRGNGTEEDEFYNSVITGHNSFEGNTQLWYLGSTSGANNDIAFINRKDADLFFSTNNTARMRIDNTGNVGINTTSPTNTLNVVGDSNITGDATIGGDINLPSTTSTIKYGTGGALATLNIEGDASIIPKVVFKGVGNEFSMQLGATVVSMVSPNNLAFTSSGGIISFNALAAGKTITFQSSTTNIVSPDIFLTGDTKVTGDLNVTETGFFNFLGSILNRITKLWVVDINVSGTIDLGTNTISDGVMTGDWDLTGDITQKRNGAISNSLILEGRQFAAQERSFIKYGLGTKNSDLLDFEGRGITSNVILFSNSEFANEMRMTLMPTTAQFVTPNDLKFVATSGDLFFEATGDLISFFSAKALFRGATGVGVNVTLDGRLNITEWIIADKIALGSNTLNGLSSGDANVSTLFYDTLTPKSPQISELEDGYIGIVDWNTLTLIKCNPLLKDDCPIESENKMKRIYDRREKESTCKSNNYSWDGECYEVIETVNNYNNVVEIIQTKEIVKINSTCSILTSTLQIETYECEKMVETEKMINKYKFKDGCDWNEELGYYCIERVLRNVGGGV